MITSEKKKTYLHINVVESKAQAYCFIFMVVVELVYCLVYLKT